MMVFVRRISRLLVMSILALVMVSCSIKQRAINSAADVFSNAERVYLSDSDPELVKAALPFNIKTLEVLLASYPEHRGLLLSTTTTTILYAFVYVESETQHIEFDDYAEADRLRTRAAALYLRAAEFGLRALEIDHPGITDELKRDPETAVLRLTRDDLAHMVWTAAAWGAAISNAKDDPNMTADIAVIGALLHRALDLDESFGEGFVHELLMSYELGRFGGSLEQARVHYERAQALSQGKKISLWLNWATEACVATQDRTQFEKLLDKVLAFDVDSAPAHRLLNILAQRKATLMKTRIDDLFL